MRIEEAYEVLGLSPDDEPDIDEVKRAYKKKALKHHPDKNKGDPKAHESFLKINEAYIRITDPTKGCDEDGSLFGEFTQEMMSSIYKSVFEELIPKGGRKGSKGRDMFDILEEMLEAEGDGGEESEEYNEDEDEEWLKDNSGRDNGYYGKALQTLFEASSKITKTVCKKRSVDTANLKNGDSKDKSKPEKEKVLSNESSKKDLKKHSKLEEPVADIASDSRINSKKSSVKTSTSSAKANKRPAVVIESEVHRKNKKIKKIDSEIYNSDSRKSSISSKASNNANSKSSSIKELHKEKSTAKSVRPKNSIKSKVVQASVSESIGVKHPSKSKLKLVKSASAPAAAVRKANSVSSPTRILHKSVASDQKSKPKEKLTQIKPKSKIKKS